MNIRKDKGRVQYSLNIVNSFVLPVIKGSLKFKQQLPQKKHTYKEHFVCDDWGYWVRIRDLESYDYDGYVYNIGVDNNHSYCANGMVTHNCMSLI